MRKMPDAAAHARQTSLVETFGTASRNYPGTEGESALTTVAVGVVHLSIDGLIDRQTDT